MIDSEAITVHIDVFEGPMDLLLYLIRKNNLDIYDIPIAQITKEYLAYIEVMKDLNLEVAGEFLVMASTLMQIKAKTLLPSQAEADGNEGPDPASELISKIQEYQRYKAVCQILDKRYDEFKDVFYRGSPVFPDSDKVLSVDLFELISCVRKALEQTEDKAEANVQAELFPIETRMEKILNMLSQKYWIRLEDIFAGETKRRGVITCFMAVLELMKQRRVIARQDSNFTEIRVYLRPEPKSPDADELPLVDEMKPVPVAQEPAPLPALDDIPDAAVEADVEISLSQEADTASPVEGRTEAVEGFSAENILSGNHPAETAAPEAGPAESSPAEPEPVPAAPLPDDEPHSSAPPAGVQSVPDVPRPEHPSKRDLRPEIEEYTRFAHELSEMVDKDVAEGLVQAAIPVEQALARGNADVAPDTAFVEKAASALSALESKAGELRREEPVPQLPDDKAALETAFVEEASSVLSVLEEKAAVVETAAVPAPEASASVPVEEPAPANGQEQTPAVAEPRPEPENNLNNDVPPEGGPKEN